MLKTKGLLSLFLFINFSLVFITGFGLFLAPSDHQARLQNWHFLFWDKFQLEKIHTLSGFWLALLLLIHVVLNFKLFKTELKCWLTKKII